MSAASLAEVLGCSEAVAASYLAHSGSPDLALERWLGHNDVLCSIASSWTAMGSFTALDDVLAARCKDCEDTGASMGPPIPTDPTEVADSSRKHADRLVELGKINEKNKRLAKELVNLKARSGLNIDVSPVGTALDHWLVKLRDYNFPSDTLLYSDMQRLSRDYPGSLDHILLEILFPPRYPVDPPFIRVVYPRFAFHTGHVTWGGSLCLETLVNTGTAGGYQATYTMETLLCMVLFNMTSDTAGTAIKQGRIDFVRDREFDRLDYSLEEGRLENFKRVADQHSWMTQADAARSKVGSGAASSWGELSRGFLASTGAAASSFK